MNEQLATVNSDNERRCVMAVRYVVFGDEVVEASCSDAVQELLNNAQCDLEIYVAPFNTIEEAEMHGFEGAVATGRKIRFEALNGRH